jgi:hypothetical protein
MKNNAQKTTQIRIDNPVAFEVQPLVDFSQRLMRALPRPEAIREILEVRLEQRFDDDLHCCLHYTIGDDRDTQWSLRSVRLRDENPPDRQRLVPLRSELCAELLRKVPTPTSFSMISKDCWSMPGAPLLALTCAYAAPSTSSLHTLSYNTPNLRFGFVLAGGQTRAKQL